MTKNRGKTKIEFNDGSKDDVDVEVGELPGFETLEAREARIDKEIKDAEDAAVKAMNFLHGLRLKYGR